MDQYLENNKLTENNLTEVNVLTPGFIGGDHGIGDIYVTLSYIS